MGWETVALGHDHLVMTEKKLSHEEYRLFMALAGLCTNDEGWGTKPHPIETMARIAQMPAGVVRRCLASLVEKSVISVQEPETDKQPAIYRLLYGAILREEPRYAPNSRD